jgi:hypothetical protein
MIRNVNDGAGRALARGHSSAAFRSDYSNGADETVAAR